MSLNQETIIPWVRFRRGGLLIIVMLFISTLFGCTHHYDLNGTIPSPVIDPLPLSVALSYSQLFKEYEYHQESDDGSTYVVRLAPAQEKLFDQLFKGLFADVTKVANIGDAPDLENTPDIIIEVTIEDYAVATPKDNGLEFYEVTIRYGLLLYGVDGALINSWSFGGYGRDRKQTFNPFDSVPLATEEAMRDAATIIAVEFREAKEIKSILCKKSNDTNSC